MSDAPADAAPTAEQQIAEYRAKIAELEGAPTLASLTQKIDALSKQHEDLRASHQRQKLHEVQMEQTRKNAEAAARNMPQTWSQAAPGGPTAPLEISEREQYRAIMARPDTKVTAADRAKFAEMQAIKETVAELRGKLDGFTASGSRRTASEATDGGGSTDEPAAKVSKSATENAGSTDANFAAAVAAEVAKALKAQEEKKAAAAEAKAEAEATASAAPMTKKMSLVSTLSSTDAVESVAEDADAADAPVASARLAEAQASYAKFTAELDKYKKRLDRFDADKKEFEKTKKSLEPEEIEKRLKQFAVRDKTIQQQSEALFDLASTHIMSTGNGMKGGVPKSVLRSLSSIATDHCRMPASTVKNLSNLVELTTESSFTALNSMAAAEAQTRELQRRWHEERLERQNAQKQLEYQQSMFESDQRVQSLDPKFGLLGVAGSVSAVQANQQAAPLSHVNAGGQSDTLTQWRDANSSSSAQHTDMSVDDSRAWKQAHPGTVDALQQFKHKGCLRGSTMTAPKRLPNGDLAFLCLQNSPYEQHRRLREKLGAESTSRAGPLSQRELNVPLRSAHVPQFRGLEKKDDSSYAIPTDAEGNWLIAHELQSAQQQAMMQ